VSRLGRSVDEADAAVESGRRMDVQHAYGTIVLVLEAVLDSGRHQHECPSGRGHAMVAEDEGHLSIDDVERIVLLMDVGFELAPGAISMMPNVKRGVSTVRATNSTLPRR
jgi:hypothetical protein